MSLKPYRHKRDFKKTPEPKGKINTKSKNLYVIQKHAASHLHYDFRLQMDGVLKSWAIPKGPSLDPHVKRLAVHVEDHPVEYGTFEGTIPAGEYGGGTVMLWDKGTWQDEDENVNKAYEKGNMKFFLKGKRLRGLWKLIRIKSDPKNWLLIKIDDEYAKPEMKYDITKAETTSITSKKTMDDIAMRSRKVWGNKKERKVNNAKKKTKGKKLTKKDM